MALRILDFANVGKQRSIPTQKRDNHADGVDLLPDRADNDPTGPKLQLHMKFFLEGNNEPLSSEHFDHTDVLLQVPLTKE